MLTPTIQCNFWTLFDSKGILCLNVTKKWHDLHTPNARWLACYGLHILAWICGGAQLLRFCHLLDHTSIQLFLQLNVIGRRYFLGDITRFFFPFLIFSFFDIPHFNYYEGFFMRIFLPQINSSSIFQDLTYNPILASINFSMRIAQLTLDELHSKPPFHKLRKLGVKVS